MIVLAVESSCDETAVAVLEQSAQGPLQVHSNLISSQTALHAPYGGVVPEVASREHLAALPTLATAAVAAVGGFSAIDACAVTMGPGLQGSLLVGMQWAKALGWSLGKPVLGVNHLEGQLASARLAIDPMPMPHVALMVSGGHTQLVLVRAWGNYQVLGQSRDDAAGEAFDKISIMLGLGYPGGPRIEQQAACWGDQPLPFYLPQALKQHGYDFSFSGLKSAAARLLAQHPDRSDDFVHAFCATVQSSIVEILCEKTVAAALAHQVSTISVVGGVAANQYLQQRMRQLAQVVGIRTITLPKSLCTDNALMIAAAALPYLAAHCRDNWQLEPRARYPLTALTPWAPLA